MSKYISGLPTHWRQ